MLHPTKTTKTTRLVYNLRKVKNGKRGRDYLCRFGEHLMALVNIALTQLSTKSDLCKYKSEGRAALTKDFIQLHTREAFGTLKSEYMKEEQKKSDGTIKECGCTDGCK